MRTTLALADDVILAAKAIAEMENRTMGDVISDLARRSLQRPEAAALTRNGIPLLPRSTAGALVTLAIVNELRDEMP